MLIGAVTLAVVLLVVLGVRVLGGGEDEAADTTPLPPAPQTSGVLRHKAIGATIRPPRRWRHRRAGRSLTLRSPDGTVLVSVSLPRGTDRSAAVLEAGVGAIRRQYRQVEVFGSVRRRVADLPANSVVTGATNSRGVRLRILTSAPQGRRRAWLVQVFAAARAKEARVAQAQVALGSLRLRD